MKMLPQVCGYLEKLHPNRSGQKKAEQRRMEEEMKDLHLQYSISFNNKRGESQSRYALKSDRNNRNEDIKIRKKKEMANKVSNFSDLIHRVAASCLIQPRGRVFVQDESMEINNEENEFDDEFAGEEEERDEENFSVWDNENNHNKLTVFEKLNEMESLMAEVFESATAVKRAYVSMQEAHCPWDPEKMRLADVIVVGELRKLGRLKERFRRSGGGRGTASAKAAASIIEAVAPYEAAVEELKMEVKSKDAEIENLKEKLRNGSGGKKGRFLSQRKVSCTQGQVASAPTTELFEVCMSQVKEASKTFTSLLLTFMRSARWDISAAVRSIESVNGIDIPTVGANHAKYVLESYVCRKIFQGFENETFYIEGTLSSLIHPEKFRQDCFAQFRDMKAMDPNELLGILPTCHFGKFCGKKFMCIIHPKMEESLFGDLEQRRQVLAGSHPRTEFYHEFLGLAKAVWLLHLLAFSLEPPPCHFQASKGADFHPEYMESVVKYSGRTPPDQVVGFPVTPGFKLGNGSIIKARVYLVPRV